MGKVKQLNPDVPTPKQEVNNNEGWQKIAAVEEHLKKYYKFFYNTVKHAAEWKPINDENQAFTLISEYKLNSIVRQLEYAKLTISKDKLRLILESDFLDQQDPIQEYFKNLPKVNGTENIEGLISTITVTNPELFKECFKKWLVATVANAMTETGCQNHTCLVLTGSQGKYKTTWLDNVCPPVLREKYLYTGRIDVKNKDTLLLLTGYLFINIDDQLKDLNKGDENAVKTLITLPAVKMRRLYEGGYSDSPRRASFMASINGNDFLTDSTGSRRFLPFEVIDIDISTAKSLDMDAVWAEAMALFQEGYQYWFDEGEMSQLYNNNESFQVHTTEYELLMEYFEPCCRAKASDYLSSSVIKARIESMSNQKLLSKKLGEALNKLGFEKWQQTVKGQKRWVWSVIERSPAEIDSSRRQSS
jgi:predicted P-loop ATPase